MNFASLIRERERKKKKGKEKIAILKGRYRRRWIVVGVVVVVARLCLFSVVSVGRGCAVSGAATPLRHDTPLELGIGYRRRCRRRVRRLRESSQPTHVKPDVPG